MRRRHIKINKIHYENGEPVKNKYRKILDIYSSYNPSSEIAVKNLVDKFESILYNIPTTRIRPDYSAE